MKAVHFLRHKLYCSHKIPKKHLPLLPSASVRLLETPHVRVCEPDGPPHPALAYAGLAPGGDRLALVRGKAEKNIFFTFLREN